MARRLLRFAAVLTLTLAAGAAAAQPLPASFVDTPASTTSSPPLVASNPTLEASLQRIESKSALWRDAAATLREQGRRVVVLASDQVVVANHPGAQAYDAFESSLVAEVAPIVRADSSVSLVVVVVNLALLQQRHLASDLPWIEFERDLHRILVHEVYAHAVPYLLAGHVSGRCPDPQPGERAEDACSIKRENAVRAELGLGRRVDYGLDGLSLSRRFRR